MSNSKTKITRRTFFKGVGALLGGGTVAALGGYAYVTQIETEWLAIEQVTIPIKNLKPAAEGFKIVHLSDFHLHPFTRIEFIREVVAQANKLKPDLTLLTGDYVLEAPESIFELAPVLAQLNARYGVFSVLGNHDYWTNAAIIEKGFAEVGLPLLKNSGLPIVSGSQQLFYLAGLDDAWSGKPNLFNALAKQLNELPSIVMVHEPDLADEIALDGRVALQLSGHTHGGQVRLPGIGAPILPPLGEKYDLGLYRVHDMWLYTTRGIGVIDPPVRLNCRPEITEITLVGTT